MSEETGYFESLDAALAQPEAVQTLELLGDDLTMPELTLPDEISKLKHLARLSIENFSHVHWPTELDLPALQHVSLTTWDNELPLALASCAGLKTLELDMNSFEFPAGVHWFFPELESLALDGVSGFADDFSGLKELRYLELAGGDLRSIPDGLRSLTKLESLDLSYTGLTSLPRAVVTLKHLEVLDIGHTEIEELPADISLLKNLRTLIFSKPLPHHDKRLVEDNYDSRLVQIRQVWTELENLEHLDLSSQRVAYCSDAVRKWRRLTTLDLSYNEMPEVPVELWSISNLKEVDLSFNRLTRLEGIEGWPELETLSLIANPLEAVPEGLFSLPQLKALDLRRIDWPEERFAELKARLPGVSVHHH